MQTTGLASDDETWTKSSDAVLAASKASSIDTKPFFSPFWSMRINSEALILSLIGVVFFLTLAMVLAYMINIDNKMVDFCQLQ